MGAGCCRKESWRRCTRSETANSWNRGGGRVSTACQGADWKLCKIHNTSRCFQVRCVSVQIAEIDRLVSDRLHVGGRRLICTNPVFLRSHKEPTYVSTDRAFKCIFTLLTRYLLVHHCQDISTLSLQHKDTSLSLCEALEVALMHFDFLEAEIDVRVSLAQSSPLSGRLESHLFGCRGFYE